MLNYRRPTSLPAKAVFNMHEIKIVVRLFMQHFINNATKKRDSAKGGEEVLQPGKHISEIP